METIGSVTFMAMSMKSSKPAASNDGHQSEVGSAGFGTRRG